MSESTQSRKLAAILAADAAGYSRLMQEDDGATVTMLDVCREVFQRNIEARQGRIVDMAGDSILAVFETVTGAVQSAVAIQYELAEKNNPLPEGRRMRFRIGVNLGELIAKDDGTVYGDGVNIAARLQSVGEPGGVCISEKVYEEVRNRLKARFEFVGEQRVKNIAEPVRAYRLTSEGSIAPPKGSSPSRRRIIVIATSIVLLISGTLVWLAKKHGDEGLKGTLATAPAVAVLAFDNLSGDASQEFFSDGITEEIIASLTRFQNVRVTARNSTFRYKGQRVDARQIGSELGVRYVVEGSVRRSPDFIRITGQVIETQSGSHVWSENYQRPITPSNILDIQQEISARIAGAIAGDAGILLAKEFNDSRGKPATNLSAYECYLRFQQYNRDLRRESHGPVRDCLEHTVELEPHYANAWAALAQVYIDEDRLGYNTGQKPLDRALAAGRQAVQLAPDSQLAHQFLANAHFFRGELNDYYVNAERAIELNPNNASVLAFLGLGYENAGRYDKGLALVNRALAIDPNPPGWYYLGPYWDHYRRGEYEAALSFAQKMNMPDYVWALAARIAALGQLGRAEEAKADIKHILELDATFETTARERRWKWLRFQEPLLDQFMDGLRKAGMKIPPRKA